MVISLHTTGSPVSRAERNKINENWNRIITGLTNLQIQINILAGGEVDELLERLNQAVNDANIAVQQAIAANDAATQETINANNTALQTALQTVSNTLTLLDGAITSANTATASANDAANNTNQAIQNAQNATQDALNAVTTMQNFVNQLSPKSEYNNEVQYSTNNIVTLNGSSFIALKNTKGNAPPIPPLVANAHWQLLALKGAKGDKGEKGEQGAATKILGSLADESEFPASGELGDGYLIKGNLYVWNGIEWENVGTIQGPKGDKGEEGPQGPPGNDADVTELAQTVTTLQQEVTDNKSEVTAHLAEIKPKVDNSWQKGVYNDVSISNLGMKKATKVFTVNQSDWKNTGNVEQLGIVMPFKGSFSGVIKVTYSVMWGGSGAWGATEVVYNLGVFGPPASVDKLNEFTITTASTEMLKGINILRPYANTSTGDIAILLFRAPDANNPMQISVEIDGTYSSNVYLNNIYSLLNDSFIDISDTGSPTTGGYPWTPQTTSFVTKTGNNIMAGGLTMGGNLSITKGVPTFEMIVPGSATSSSASIQLNASSTVDYGLEFKKNNTPFQIVHDQTNVVFMGYDSKWFSIQDLKQSASDVKTNVAAAITEQGVTTSPTATGAQMAANIRKIQSSKSATGRVSPNGSTTVTVRGLAFRPKTISLKMVGVSYTSNGFASYVPKALTSNTWEDTKVFITTGGSTGLDSATTVYDDGFTMQIHNTGTYEEYGYYVTG
ncbi:hypothetical protein ACQKII_19145 [Lysinibacillus sp. NPDC048646]|uniref:hypothetical protein n=1 Tax=Lysinibacillus sp. NPDC048646 TaxID=3390574 RepID=UPI003CFF6F17